MFAFTPSILREVKEKTSKLKMIYANFLTNFSLLILSLAINCTTLTSTSELSKITNKKTTTFEVGEEVMITEGASTIRINREMNVLTSFLSAAKQRTD